MAETRIDEGPAADESGELAVDPTPILHAPEAGEARIVIVQKGGASVPLVMLPALLLIAAALGILVYRQSFPHPTEGPSNRVATRPVNPAEPQVSDESKGPEPVPVIERPQLEIRSILDPSIVLGNIEGEPSKPASIGFAHPSEPKLAPLAPLAAANPTQLPPSPTPIAAPESEPLAGIEALVPPPDAVDPGEAKAEVAEVKPAAEPPKLTRDQVLKDIQRESTERKAEIRAIEAIKPKLAERDKQQSLERRKVEVAEARKRADAQRPRFRAELRRVLAGRGDALGTQVSELRERSLLPVQPEIEDAVAKAFKGSARKTKFTRNGRIEFMRSKGMSEPDILGILAYDEGMKISQRGSARDLREVWVRAAKQLLAVPFPAERAAQGNPPANQAGVSSPPPLADRDRPRP
ncbi:hypothetical protein EP7_001277 [Isosphaeraceae bacterium EP7]